MSFIFDFGLSQEDPLSELRALGVSHSDSILSLASGGEVPLSLVSLIDGIRVRAVDISGSQVSLCRLKHVAAVKLEFPLNGKFLGFGNLEPKKRIEIYHDVVRPSLSGSDISFWDQNITFIGKGIINAGRFEQYIRNMRVVAGLFIGKGNLDRLIACSSIPEQNQVFDQYIAPRKSLRLLFKVAFHPAIYRKRGLQEQALIHAEKSTGERFFSKFRDFCTTTPASENYFLQYFLTGTCITPAAYPHYLQPVNRQRFTHGMAETELSAISMQEALTSGGKGYFNKIHLSNLGDWLNTDDFNDLLVLIKNWCAPGTRICYRFLQKNHFAGKIFDDFIVDNAISESIEQKDRFPFYGFVVLTLKDGLSRFPGE
jgi:S-adenosylmethionine-diacylglycerol 3-amino-3-carboxypropyl transferase